MQTMAWAILICLLLSHAQAGLDSLGSVELRSQVSQRFGIALPATLAFDYPTVQALAEFIAPQLAPASSLGRTSTVLPLKSERSLAVAPPQPQMASVVVQAVASQFPNAENGGEATMACRDINAIVSMLHHLKLPQKGI